MDPLVGPIRAVVFDAVGTLLRPEPSVAAAYRRCAAQFGSQLDEGAIQARFRAAFARQEAADHSAHELRTSETRERDRWRRIVADVFADLPDTEPLFATLWDHFAAAENWRLYDDVQPCLQRLTVNADVVLAVASNFDQRLRAVIGAIPPLAGISRVYVSSLIGARKPSPEFFAAVADDLRLSPQEILLVGDDEANDYSGALAAGWQSVLLDRGASEHAPGRIMGLTQLVW